MIVAATSEAVGCYHPAVRWRDSIWYWPNITYSRDEDALGWAIDTIHKHEVEGDLAMAFVYDWNIVEQS